MYVCVYIYMSLHACMCRVYVKFVRYGKVMYVCMYVYFPFVYLILFAHVYSFGQYYLVSVCIAIYLQSQYHSGRHGGYSATGRGRPPQSSEPSADRSNGSRRGQPGNRLGHTQGW